MRIAILNITGGGISEGYKKYLKNLLPLMSRHRDIESILCASPENLAVPTWFQFLDNVTFTNIRPVNLFESKDVELHKQLEKFHPDIIFIPVMRYFNYGNTPTVCMLQNMLPLVSIKHSRISEVIRNKVQKIVTYKALKKSQRIIAVSQFVADFIQHEYQIPSHKIGIVYHGVSLPQNENLTTPAVISSEWAKHFIFTAGSIEIFRGLEDIIFAIHHLKQRGLNYRVIIAGYTRPAMKSYYRKLRSLVDHLGINENICWTGMLNEKEMAWCYKNASVFIMSSRIEACPNIALEAMSHGKAIISTNVPPMQEFFEETGKYYIPGDFKGLSEKIIEVFAQKDREAMDISKALVSKALNFSWQKTVGNTVEEFKKAEKS